MSHSLTQATKRETMSHVPGKKLAASVLVLAVTLTGCAAPRLTATPSAAPDAIKTFADGAALSGKAVGDAFDLVNRSYYASQGASYLAGFNTALKPPALADFVPAASVTARVAVFDQLAEYAALLVDISGNDRGAALDSASSALATSMQSLRGSGATDVSVNLATGINAIGALFLNGKRYDGAAAAAKAADPQVQTICRLMREDIATLRNQLHVSYVAALQDQFRYLKESLTPEKSTAVVHLAALDAVQKRQEIERLVDVARQEKAGMAILDQLQTMIDSLGTAHAAIADAYGQSASARQKASAFLGAAKRLRQFHSGLTISEE